MSSTLGRGLWLRRFHEVSAPRATLVCFPHAGGSATFFFPASRTLADRGVQVVAVQYPGRQDRRAEPCIEDIGVLADKVTRVLLEAASAPDDGDPGPALPRATPLALFGHSMGATVSYEVARRLEAVGVSPLRLSGVFASGRRAPSWQGVENVHQRDDDGVVAALRELSGTDSAVLGDEELLRMVLPAVRSDYKAVETYRHGGGEELSCPVTVLVGDSDPVTTLTQAEAWRKHTNGGFRMEVFPGGHFYLNTQAGRVVDAIDRQLASWLTAA